MIKKVLLISIALLASALIFEGTHKKIETKVTLSESVPAKKVPMVISKTKEEVKKKPDEKSDYAYKNVVRQKLASSEEDLMILKGVHASSEKKTEADLGRVNNFYVYPASSASEENIVYNPARNQYGLLTREIIVTGDDAMVQALAQKYHLSIEKEGRLGSEYVLRARDSAFFIEKMAQFKAEEGISEARPYVQYGQAKLR